MQQANRQTLTAEVQELGEQLSILVKNEHLAFFTYDGTYYLYLCILTYHCFFFIIKMLYYFLLSERREYPNCGDGTIIAMLVFLVCKHFI
jgi:uncharacterized membrane protein YagU involved in acid resistance